MLPTLFITQGSHPDDPKINPGVDEFLYLRDYFQSVDSGRIIIGVNILVIMVRLIWLFSNAAPSFALILHTLEASMYRLTNFFVILMFFLIGFSFLAMILFGQEIRGFQTFLDCFVSLFKAILGDIDLAEMQETHGKWGRNSFLHCLHVNNERCCFEHFNCYFK